jgi:hypothetical protein
VQVLLASVGPCHWRWKKSRRQYVKSRQKDRVFFKSGGTTMRLLCQQKFLLNSPASTTYARSTSCHYSCRSALCSMCESYLFVGAFHLTTCLLTTQSDQWDRNNEKTAKPFIDLWLIINNNMNNHGITIIATVSLFQSLNNCFQKLHNSNYDNSLTIPGGGDTPVTHTHRAPSPTHTFHTQINYITIFARQTRTPTHGHPHTHTHTFTMI